MEPYVLIIVIVIVVPIMLLLIEFFKNIFKGIALTPGKGFSKFLKYLKNRKAISNEAKLNNALLMADRASRLNAAKNNPNYRNYPSVKKILAKREYKQSKKESKKLNK